MSSYNSNIIIYNLNKVNQNLNNLETNLTKFTQDLFNNKHNCANLTTCDRDNFRIDTRLENVQFKLMNSIFEISRNLLNNNTKHEYLIKAKKACFDTIKSRISRNKFSTKSIILIKLLLARNIEFRDNFREFESIYTRLY